MKMNQGIGAELFYLLSFRGQRDRISQEPDLGW
jgi:hypothetical protein